MKTKVVAIVQARMGSARLPEKVLREIEGKPVLVHVIERIRVARKLESIVIATTNRKADGEIVRLAQRLESKYFTGSESDVLTRYYEAARREQADILVRVTADNVLTDPWEIDRIVARHIEFKADYTHNKHDKGAPFGTGVEVISFPALEKAHKLGTQPHHREHVTPFIKEHPEMFKIEVLDARKSIQRHEIRLTIDTEDDLKLIREIYKVLYHGGRIFRLEEVVKLLDSNPYLREINAHIPNV